MLTLLIILSVIKNFVFALILLLASSLAANCQGKIGPYDTIILRGIVIGKDTFPYKYLNPVGVKAIVPKWAKAARQENDAAYRILRYNVYKAYPYAVKTSLVLAEIDSVLLTIYSKEAKRAYKERKEAELNAKFNKELYNLSMDQGKILIKLVSRQTGKSVYEIVKSLKGGLNATVFQGMALLWDNNLKTEYDPNGEDAAIEAIVQEIESRNRPR